jgi:hypothetical protein
MKLVVLLFTLVLLLAPVSSGFLSPYQAGLGPWSRYLNAECISSDNNWIALSYAPVGQTLLQGSALIYQYNGTGFKQLSYSIAMCTPSLSVNAYGTFLVGVKNTSLLAYSLNTTAATLILNYTAPTGLQFVNCLARGAANGTTIAYLLQNGTSSVGVKIGFFKHNGTTYNAYGSQYAFNMNSM